MTRLGQLVRLQGEDTSNRVKGIHFDGITFSHNNYLFEDFGVVTVQNNANAIAFEGGNNDVNSETSGANTPGHAGWRNWHHYRYNSNSVMPGAVELCNAEDIQFINGEFSNLTGTGLNILNDTVNVDVVGNVFKYISGAGLNVGSPQHYAIGNVAGDGDVAKGKTAVWTDETEGKCTDTLVSNNVFRNVSWEHVQCGGITGYFIEDARYLHNDLRGTPYAGFHVGWWWGASEIPPSTWSNSNKINYNRVAHVAQMLEDTGLVYILGQNGGTAVDNYPNTALWSEIKGNHLTHARRHHVNGIHPDDCAAFWKIEDNVIENYTKEWIHMWAGGCINVVQNNFSTGGGGSLAGTAYPAGANRVTVQADAPPWKSTAARAIIAKAGIEPAYSHVMDRAYPKLVNPYLSDLQFYKSGNAWGRIGFDKHNSEAPQCGGLISLNGKVYQKGLGLEASCYMSYDLTDQPGLAAPRRFISDVGVQTGRNGGATFEVLDDGKVLATKKAGGPNTASFDVDIRGVKTLTLKAHGSGWVNWAGAQIITTPTSQAILTDARALRVPEGTSNVLQVKLQLDPGLGKSVVVTPSIEGDTDLTIASKARLVFSHKNWNRFEKVVVAAADDADGSDGVALIKLSAKALPTKSVSVSEVDDDIVLPDPLIWWRFDDAAGARRAHDASGNGNDGTLVNGVTAGSPGKIGRSYAFDGKNDYVYRKIAPPSAGQTVCGWVKTTANARSLWGWANAHPLSNENDRNVYIDAGGTVSYRIYDGAVKILSSKSTVNDGKWHHIACVFAPGRGISIFVDGRFERALGSSAPHSGYSNPHFTVGIEQMKKGYLSGNIDDVRVYDSALTTTQIQTVYRHK
jgi:hypothetical protein